MKTFRDTAKLFLLLLIGIICALAVFLVPQLVFSPLIGFGITGCITLLALCYLLVSCGIVTFK